MHNINVKLYGSCKPEFKFNQVHSKTCMLGLVSPMLDLSRMELGVGARCSSHIEDLSIQQSAYRTEGTSTICWQNGIA